MLVNPYLGPQAGPTGDPGILAAGFVTMSGSTPTINKHKNISGTPTRNGAGDFTVDFASALPHANYFVLAFARAVDGASDGFMVATAKAGGTYSTSSVQITIETANATRTDPLYWGFLIVDADLLADTDYSTAAMWTISGGVVTLEKQRNMASIGRTAAGRYTANYTSALADANYSAFRAARFVATNAGNPRLATDRSIGGGDNSYTSALQDFRAWTSSATFGEVDKGGVLVKYASGQVPGQLAAVRFDSSGTIISQHNVTSVANQGSSVWRVTFTTPLADAQNLVLCTAKDIDQASGSSADWVGPNPNTTSTRGEFTTTSVDVFVATIGGTADTTFTSVDVWVIDPSLA